MNYIVLFSPIVLYLPNLSILNLAHISKASFIFLMVQDARHFMYLLVICFLLRATSFNLFVYFLIEKLDVWLCTCLRFYSRYYFLSGI